MNLGLVLEPGPRPTNLLTRYLANQRSPRQIETVHRTGWFVPGSSGANTDFGFAAPLFVLPDGPIGKGGTVEVVFDPGDDGSRDREPKGTLAEWQDAIGRHAIGNSRVALAILAALASPLMQLIGLDGGGIHFRGGSSVGKTTALWVASSVWGLPVFDWRTTDNALETTAARHNDLLLCLDEIGQVEPRIVGAVAYMLANGRGKARMTSDRASAPRVQWRVQFMSTGEMALADCLAQAGSQVQAGQEVRFLDLPADAGAGAGLFEHVPAEFGSPAAFADHLKSASQAFRGVAGREFLRRLLERYPWPELERRVRDQVKVWTAARVAAGADGQVERVARRFALWCAAGELATELGILPWPERAAEFATARCYGDWIAERGGFGAGEVRIAVDRLRLFIDCHGAGRFQDVTELATLGSEEQHQERDGRVYERAGYRRRNPDGSITYLFFPGTWRKEIVQSLDLKAINKAVVTMGIVEAGPSGEAAPQVKINGTNGRFYRVREDRLREDEHE